MRSPLSIMQGASLTKGLLSFHTFAQEPQVSAFFVDLPSFLSIFCCWLETGTPARRNINITGFFSDWFSISIDSPLAYLWQTALSSCDLQKLQYVFPLLQPNRVDNAVQEFSKTPEKIKGSQSSHPVSPSSYFFISFHWSLSHLICCQWAFVILFLPVLWVEPVVFAYQKLTKPCRNLH